MKHNPAGKKQEAGVRRTAMLIVQTTCKTSREAERIASALVKEGLAACAHAFPCKSFFFWKGKMRKEGEWLLELKVRDADYGNVERKIKSLHSYDLPEIVALRPAKASREYSDWVLGKAKKG